jgi:hypothetical protein
MTIGHLTSREQTKVIKATSATNDVRTLIADHLGVSVRRVTDDAHLTDGNLEQYPLSVISGLAERTVVSTRAKVEPRSGPF